MVIDAIQNKLSSLNQTEQSDSLIQAVSGLLGDKRIYDCTLFAPLGHAYTCVALETALQPLTGSDLHKIINQKFELAKGRG
jgi:hypothetical protein